jgi:HD-GYP domain-containing protein (c-di-GMP phosphodiesterase class II)
VEVVSLSSPSSPSDFALKDQVRRWELLLEVGLDLHAERNFDLLLKKILHRLTEVMRAERSSLFLFDEDERELHSKVAEGSEEISLPVGVGIAGEVARTGQSLNIPDVYRDSRFNPAFDRRSGFHTRSLLTVPLKTSRSGVIGVVQVLNKVDGRPFSEEDEELAEAFAATAAVAIETHQLFRELQQSFDAVMKGLNAALDARDPAALGHSFMVQAFADALAKTMEVPDDERTLIHYAAALHDFGKIGVPDRILAKQSPLEGAEREEYELHALKTKILLERLNLVGDLADVAKIAPFNHKRFGGGGFPAGPPEKCEIPLGARIIAVADELHNLRSSRYGNAPLTLEGALERIAAQAGERFDPGVVAALFRLSPELPAVEAEGRRNYEAVRIHFFEGGTGGSIRAAAGT